jgi:uncharacterized phage protein (TIGR01671 family)
MREIRFRAWDKTTKTMLYIEPFEYIHIMTGKCRFDDGLIDDGHYLERDDFILMQFTGLKDKNGKDIYEGDILSHFEGKYQIIYNDNHACFMADGFYEARYDDPCNIFEEIERHQVEIIGNIYENPELLKPA